MSTAYVPFGDDPGTDTFTVYVDGVQVDPMTLPGYVATGPNVSITEAAKTGDWTIRDDGCIEYVRPMTAMEPGQTTAQFSPPSGGMCVVVCDKTGVVVRIEGTPVPDGIVVGQPMPTPSPAVDAPVVVPEALAPVAAPAVEGSDAPSAPPPPPDPVVAPEPVVEVPHTATVTITPHSSGGVLVRIETATGEVITKVVKMAEHLVAEVATFAHQHFGQH